MESNSWMHTHSCAALAAMCIKKHNLDNNACRALWLVCERLFTWSMCAWSMCTFNCTCGCVPDKGVTGKFFWGGKVIFPGVKCFFPVENFNFGRPKTNFSSFWKVRRKKKKKKASSYFVTFPPSIFNFPPSLLQFSFFFFSIFTPFPFFFFAFFPGRSAEISRSDVSGGALCSPRLLRNWCQTVLTRSRITFHQ